MLKSQLMQSRWMMRLLPVMILLLLGVLWGGVPSIAKYVLTQVDIHPLSYSAWVLIIAASVLITINFINGRKLPPRHLTFYTICGLTSSAIPTTIMYYAVVWIPAGLMALLLTVAPILTYVFGMIVKVEKYHPLKTLGLMLAIIGIMLILMPGTVEKMNAPVWAILLGLLTPAFYSINIVYAALRRPENLHVMDMSVGMLIVAAITLVVVTVVFESFYPLWDADPYIVLLVFYHGTLTALAFCFFYFLIKLAGPLFSSQVTYTVTIFGILIGAYVHDEVLPLLVWIATIVMFFGIGFIQRARRLTLED